jgi:hypothetical protein
LSCGSIGSYETAIVAFAIALLISCGLILTLGPYRYPAVNEAEEGAAVAA